MISDYIWYVAYLWATWRWCKLVYLYFSQPSRSQDGFCYVSQTWFLDLRLGPWPLAGDLMDAVDFPLFVIPHGVGRWHVVERRTEGEVLLSTIPRGDRVGSAEQFAELAKAWRQFSEDEANRARSAAVNATLRAPTFERTRRVLHEVVDRFAWTRRSGRWHTTKLLPMDECDDPLPEAVEHTVRMTPVDAAEAGKVLNSSPDSLGESSARMDVGAEVYKKGIPTSVPPSSPNYARLTRMLGPLAYRTKIEGHPEAATCRRAALGHASVVLQGAVVGLVSPSTTEMHTFPNGAFWLYRDSGLDASRRAKHCTLCKQPVCQILTAARADGRCLEDNNYALAAGFFARFGVQALVLLNIEPNIQAADLLRIMVQAEVPTAYSLTTVDWRALVVPEALDSLIGMTTTVEGDKLVSCFSDAGDYLQRLDNAKALFRPTFAEGASLRRTVIFGSDATQYFELTVSESLVATRCVPQQENYYFLRVPTPEGTDYRLLVERNGFNRVLATYRTQAVKDLSTARVVLRQANVTYSIAGTQVTPRIKLSATEAEALAVWVVVYSEVQDAIAGRTSAALMRPSTGALVATSVWTGVTERLKSTTTGQIALGTASAVETALGAYRRSIAEKTLDQLSHECFTETFGHKISYLSMVENFTSRWTSYTHCVKRVKALYSLVTAKMLGTWRLGFYYTDLMVVAGLLGVRLNAELAGMVVDATLIAVRMLGAVDVEVHVKRLQRYLTWSQTKAERVWVGVQDAQRLDFQAASIDIVEVFFNTFAVDPAQEHLQRAESVQEGQEPEVQEVLLDEEARAALDLPYSDFLSEVKRFLSSYNTRAARLTVTQHLLGKLNRDRRHASAGQRERMVHILRQAERDVTQATPVTTLRFALGAEPVVHPLPLRPLQFGQLQQDIRQVFEERGRLYFTPRDGVASTLERLETIDGRVDFTPIHALMEEQHPGLNVLPAHLKGPNYVSPDERGSMLTQRLVQHVYTQRLGVTFCAAEALRPWFDAQMRSPLLIEPVEKMMREAEGLVDAGHVAGWLAHIDGLAFGGKSASTRGWITADDLVVVPTRKLKLEWQEKLGKADPVQRASVVTQHEALVSKLTNGFVFIDEAHTFDPEHLQMLANRHFRAKGIVTIGDGHQIGNVFSATDVHLDVTAAPTIIVTPVSFAPWDCLAIYLEKNTSSARAERYFCGSSTAEGLTYTLGTDDVLLPGVEDLAIQGTQLGKAKMVERGVAETLTAHESQGARCVNTVVHGIGYSLERDVNWLAAAGQEKHLGVTITRASKRTIFVVDALYALRNFNWVDYGVNGELPNDCIFGGTAWDLVEPRTENDAVEEYLHEPILPESYLVEKPLTDPVTIGTTFVNGEAVSLSEVRPHVILSDGVKFTDEGIPHSDKFDEYTTQPRDFPGVDQIQGLTRAVRGPKPSVHDFMNAERIVNRIFEQVIDPKIFFAHLANSRRNTLNRRERQQVIDGCKAEQEVRASTLSFGFLKPEFSKKPSELFPNGELKAQGVITAAAMQQALFMDSCDALTHAWARSMRQGKFSPVGFKEQDIDSVLSTFETSWELDLEKQDSSHKAVHVLVACRFLELASERLGLDQVALEIREQRTVRMMKDPFTFVLQWALASGDPWTLIFNKIMAVSSLISVADLTDVRMMQTGDDITLDRQPSWLYEDGLRAQRSANRGLTWKKEEREQRRQGVTFISRGALPNRTIVYKALRTILKYTHRRRTRLQHESFKTDTVRLLEASAGVGLQAYCHARCHVFGGDPVVVYDMWSRAIALANQDFDTLPDHLRDDSEKPFTIKSHGEGCFGYALAHCVSGNVKAINAIASYPRTTMTSTCLKVCKEEKVGCVVIDETWANASKRRLTQAVETFKINLNKAFVAVYRDHCVAVVPTTLVRHTSAGKRVFRWKTLHADALEVHSDL